MKTITFALALTLSGAAAAAQPVFKWSADDLATLDGVASTHQRIESLARQFCRDHLQGTRDLTRATDCFDAVVEEIVLSVNDQRLTVYAETGTVSDDLLARR